MTVFMLLEVENLRSLQPRLSFSVARRFHLGEKVLSSGILLLTEYNFYRKKTMAKFPRFFSVIRLKSYHLLENWH